MKLINNSLINKIEMLYLRDECYVSVGSREARLVWKEIRRKETLVYRRWIVQEREVETITRGGARIP